MNFRVCVANSYGVTVPLGYARLWSEALELLRLHAPHWEQELWIEERAWRRCGAQPKEVTS